jgi:uncharacterized protein with HEPN domain
MKCSLNLIVSMRPERLYLSDILHASRNVALHIGGRSRDGFIADPTVRAAALHELTVIGEAAARIPGTMRDRHPTIPSADVIAFRNIVVHEYFGLSLPLVWETATRDVPESERQIKDVLMAEFPDTAGPI